MTATKRRKKGRGKKRAGNRVMCNFPPRGTAPRKKRTKKIRTWIFFANEELRAEFSASKRDTCSHSSEG